MMSLIRRILIVQAARATTTTRSSPRGTPKTRAILILTVPVVGRMRMIPMARRKTHMSQATPFPTVPVVGRTRTVPSARRQMDLAPATTLMVLAVKMRTIATHSAQPRTHMIPTTRIHMIPAARRTMILTAQATLIPTVLAVRPTDPVVLMARERMTATLTVRRGGTIEHMVRFQPHAARFNSQPSG